MPAVPISGCFSTSTAMMKGNRSGAKYRNMAPKESPFLWLPMWTKGFRTCQIMDMLILASTFFARDDAAQMRPVTFAISEGCREMGPRAIHRVAPFTVRPATMTSPKSSSVRTHQRKAPFRMMW